MVATQGAVPQVNSSQAPRRRAAYNTLMLFALAMLALVVALLVVTFFRPLMWMRVERDLTGLDEKRLIADRQRYAASIRIRAVIGIVLVVLLAIALISFDTQVEMVEGQLHRQLEADRARLRNDSPELRREKLGLPPYPPVRGERPPGP